MNTVCGVTPWRMELPAHRKDAAPWLVIHDPSGDFLGRRFRLLDLTAPQWEEGTIFWHTAQGDVRIWRNGKYHALHARRKGRKA